MPLSPLLLYIAGAVALMYFTFVGAMQLPAGFTARLLGALLVPGAVFLWLRHQAILNGRRGPTPLSGVLLIVLGPFLVGFHLLRTRRDRGAAVTVLLGLVAFAPLLGLVIGTAAFQVLPIVPRYADIGDGRGEQRVTAELAARTAERDFTRIAGFLAEERAAGRRFPSDAEALYASWQQRRPQQDVPMDLFTGAAYHYEPRDTGYGLWSAGPDRQLATDDDLWFVWPSISEATATVQPN